MSEGHKSFEQFDRIPTGTFEAELTDRQKAGIRHVLEIGRDIQKRFSAIAEDYRHGMTQDKIMEKYKIIEVYGINIDIARLAVSSALRGYDGRLSEATNVDPYSGLIEGKTELDAIAKDHRIAGAKKQLDEKRGIHGHTLKERKEIGRLGAISQGSRPYSEEEKSLVRELAAQAEYQRKSRINAMKIAAEINRRLHGGKEVRDRFQIKKLHHLLKKDIPEK